MENHLGLSRRKIRRLEEKKQEMRKVIRALDRRLLRILARRGEKVLEIVEIKAALGEPVIQHDIEELHIKDMLNIAARLGLNQNFAALILRSIVNESRLAQIEHLQNGTR